MLLLLYTPVTCSFLRLVICVGINRASRHASRRMRMRQSAAGRLSLSDQTGSGSERRRWQSSCRTHNQFTVMKRQKRSVRKHKKLLLTNRNRRCDGYSETECLLITLASILLMKLNESALPILFHLWGNNAKFVQSVVLEMQWCYLRVEVR